MVDLNYDNHLEVQLIKNKEPSPKSDLDIVLTVGITLTIAITLGLSLITDPEQGGASPTTPYWIPSPTPSNGNAGISDKDLNSQLKDPQPGDSAQINECNGVDYAGANFRDYPALTPLTILGVVPEGELVTLTGETTSADGTVWYEAVNNSTLIRSDEPSAQNRTSANQTGWIAACFLSHRALW